MEPVDKATGIIENMTEAYERVKQLSAIITYLAECYEYFKSNGQEEKAAFLMDAYNLLGQDIYDGILTNLSDGGEVIPLFRFTEPSLKNMAQRLTRLADSPLVASVSPQAAALIARVALDVARAERIDMPASEQYDIENVLTEIETHDHVPFDRQEMIKNTNRWEAEAGWITDALHDHPDEKFRKVARLTLYAKKLLFACATQLTAEHFDLTNIITPRTLFTISNPTSAPIQEILGTLTALDEQVGEAAEYTLGFEEHDDDEYGRTAGSALQAAHIHLDTAKSILAVVIAGYDYLNEFDDDGDLVVPPPLTQESNPVGAYL